MTLSSISARERICTRCPERGAQPWDAFHAAVKWEDGTMRRPQSRCKACLRELNLERYHEMRRTAKGRRKLRGRWRRKYRAMRADPERAATRNAYERDYYRTKRSPNPTPERWIDNAPMLGLVESAPVLTAIVALELSVQEVATRMGRDREPLAKALKAERMQARTAVAILGAIDVLPCEIGL